jgi:hypothetical protein
MADTTQAPPASSPAQQPATLSPISSQGEAAGADMEGVKVALSNFMESSGVKGIWDSPTMRGVRKWMSDSPFGKALMTFGGAFIATKMIGAFLPDSKDHATMYKIGGLLLFGALAGVLAHNSDHLLGTNKSPTQMAFGGAATPEAATPPALRGTDPGTPGKPFKITEYQPEDFSLAPKPAPKV